MTQQKLGLVALLTLGACIGKSTGDGVVNLDHSSIGAVSSWAEPSGVSLGIDGPTQDYMGWTIHFSHASPGVDCGTAPDLASVASIDIITTQLETETSDHVAPRAVLVPGDIPFVTEYPTTITSSFAVGNVDAPITTLNIGRVTITGFGDTIDGTFSATGTEANVIPPDTVADGTFHATRCLD
jgi:hypothetical protein